MGRPDLTYDGDQLTTSIDKGNKQWVARVDGTDNQYDLDREFVSPYGQGTKVAEIDDGTVIEMCWHSHGGREKGRKYYTALGSELVEIDREHVERVLNARVAIVDADSTYEAHECEQCGDEFASAHGLAVHKALVHGDDGGDETDDIDATPTPSGDQPVAVDGGVVADGGDDESDWDLAAGDRPARNGTRTLVPSDETETRYTGDEHSPKLECCGVTIDMQTSIHRGELKTVRLDPHDPSRASRAGSRDWLFRTALAESDTADLWGEGDVDDPLPGYESETTGDYRQADPEDPRGDGVYARDKSDSPLTGEIADIVTRNGGRIPVDFSATVQNEGYMRDRTWRIYAPGSNPYHIAAAVTDLLNETEGVTEVNVWVSDKTGADIEGKLRATGINYVFNSDDEADLLERALREVRWESGLPLGYQRALEARPSEARRRVDDADLDDGLTDYKTLLRKCHERPGDAWNYYEVSIQAIEEAEVGCYV